MKKTAIFYGSTTGTTESVAQRIAEQLGLEASCVHEVSEMTPELIDEQEVLILGTSTWGDGELQDDWYDGVEVLKEANLAGKTVALFGCGDSSANADTFCNGMGLIYEDIKDSGCTLVEGVDAADYDYSSSDSVIDGKFVGLAIDDVNESDKTDDRIAAWAANVKAVIA